MTGSTYPPESAVKMMDAADAAGGYWKRLRMVHALPESEATRLTEKWIETHARHAGGDLAKVWRCFEEVAARMDEMSQAVEEIQAAQEGILTKLRRADKAD